ncbi:transglutaminase-like domain-containing protein [Patulibacter defluvii]|uniref:transglutaminase-like domain-containing protein n=1 Tax=Patulibacter defluvii TaxID=3095358 RepID=UPI002A760C7D|nr:transglutaminase domain-containing protein [Patulibacter sp. DM4]
MTGPPPRRAALVDLVGLAALLAVALAAWWPLLGGAQLRVLPAVAVAGLVLVGRIAPRHVLLALLVWAVAALPIGGTSIAVLWPSRWSRLGDGLVDGTVGLERLASASPLDGAWPLTLALIAFGSVALLAAAVVRGPGPRALRRPLALALLLAPWGLALTIRQGELPPWQGAVVVVAALAWLRQGTAAGPSPRWTRPLAAALAIGLLAALVGHLAAPQERWLAVGDVLRRQEPLRTLEVEPSYGPLQGRRSGATMFEVRADRPGLWRMQTLDLMTIWGWRIRDDGGPWQPLPQPGAVPTEVEIRIDRLRSALVLAPGRPTDAGPAEPPDDPGEPVPASFPGAGESRRLPGVPGPGARYVVTADVVDPTLAQLRGAPLPSDSRLERWTTLGRPYGRRDGRRLGPVPLFGQPRNAWLEQWLDRSRLGPVAAISRRVVGDASTQYEAVDRVLRYLRDGQRFTYDTDLPPAGISPLIEFLTETHRGYCQHFAGAAGMLLRLAGVPTRVVSGFATGTEVSPGRFEVRDVDAHQWIEVYFPELGWVPFDPTPPGDATVDPEAVPLAAAAARGTPGGSGGTLVVLLLAALAGGGTVVAVRRRRPAAGERDGWDGLGAVARRAGLAVTAATTPGALATGVAVIGPRTAALARDAERAAYAAAAPADAARRPGPWAVGRALVGDRGWWGALTLLLGRPLSARRRRARRRRPAAPGAPPAGRARRGRRGRRASR